MPGHWHASGHQVWCSCSMPGPQPEQNAPSATAAVLPVMPVVMLSTVAAAMAAAAASLSADPVTWPVARA
eukprot:3861422-Rhodomonas_salina.1